MLALLTRPREDAERLADALAAKGIESLIEPLLTVEYRKDAVVALSGVAALIFTSANGARAFAALRPERWLPCFAVGDGTAAALREAGFLAVTNAKGDVGDLAELVRRRLDARRGVLLHVAGSAVAGDLAGLLEKAGFVVRRVVLYEAIPTQRLSKPAVDALAAGTIDLVVIFSPRTAATFASLVAAHHLAASLERVTLVALSRNVAEAAAALPWRAVRVASEPTMASLVQLMDEFAGRASHTAYLSRRPMSEPAAEHRAAAAPQQAIIGGPTLAEPGPAATAAAPSNPPSPPRRRRRSALLALLLAILLLIAGLWLTRAQWQPELARLLAGPAPPTGAAGGLDERLAQIERRLAAQQGAGADQRLDALADELKLVRELLAQPSTDAHVPPPDLKPLEDRIAGLGQGLSRLDQRLGELTLKVQQLEAQPKPPAIDPAELQRLEQAQRQLGDRLAAEEAAPKANPADAQLLSQLQESQRNLAERVIKLETALAAERATAGREAALVLAVTQLKSALAGSGGYASELKAVKALAGGDPEIVQAAQMLEPRAQRGVPTVEMLRASFDDAAAAASRAEIAGPDQGIVGEALNRLAGLVSIRRRNTSEGVAGQLSRAEKALQAGDLDGAILAADSVQGPAADAMKPWLAEAKARLAADRAVERMLQRATQLLAPRPAP